MTRVVRLLLQLAAYAGFAVVIGYLSFWPKYDYASPGTAEIKILLSHAATRVEPCVQLTPQEIAELAPNMRRELVCERERLPLILELAIDGEVVRSMTVQPSGLWNDGPAFVYERFEVEPGPHRITARLRDTARTEGWDYAHTEDVILEAGRYLSVTFRPEAGGFSVR